MNRGRSRTRSPSQETADSSARRAQSELSPSLKRLLAETSVGNLSEEDLLSKGILHTRDLAYGWEAEELISFDNPDAWLRLRKQASQQAERRAASTARLAHVVVRVAPRQAKQPELHEPVLSHPALLNAARTVTAAKVSSSSSLPARPFGP